MPRELGETFDVGSDTRTSVDDSDYQVPTQLSVQHKPAAVFAGCHSAT
jgi:hypothetical protein